MHAYAYENAIHHIKLGKCTAAKGCVHLNLKKPSVYESFEARMLTIESYITAVLEIRSTFIVVPLIQIV